MKAQKNKTCLLLAIIALLPVDALAANTLLPALTLTPNPDGSQTYTLSLQILALMTALTMLPAIVLMMTSFTRIIIVLAILRQALGTSSTPSNQILLGMALFLSFFIMTPVLNKVYDTAVEPFMANKISEVEMAERAIIPFKEFMLQQTREDDIELFASMANSPPINTPQDTPFRILLPAFVTSELKTAFQIGFLIFIPFIVIDLTVASVLMSMGMMMLSPMIISLPFKLMLFVLVDGWALIMGTLAASFYVK